MRGRTIKEDIEERMKDPAFKKAWHDLDGEFEVLESIIKTREAAEQTQEELPGEDSRSKKMTIPGKVED